MEQHPDSLYEGAKKVVATAEVPWPTGLRVLREIQSADDDDYPWLPKSQGRRIYLAHPSYVARYLIALAGALNDPTSARPFLKLYAKAHLVGQEPDLDPLSLVACISHALFIPQHGADIQSIDFYPPAGRAVINYYEAPPSTFGTSHGGIPSKQLIRCYPVILGDLIRELYRKVNWLTPGLTSRAEGDAEVED